MAESGRPRTRAFRFVALALLLCAGLVAAQESLVHTDDGCAVEIHCLACRWAYSADAVFVAAPALLVLHDVVHAVVPAPGRPVSRTAIDVPAPRGPPAA